MKKEIENYLQSIGFNEPVSAASVAIELVNAGYTRCALGLFEDQEIENVRLIMENKSPILPLGGERGYNIEPKNQMAYSLMQYVSTDPNHLYEYQLTNSNGCDVCYFSVTAADIHKHELTVDSDNLEFLQNNPNVTYCILTELFS